MAQVIEKFDSKKGRPPQYPWTAEDARHLEVQEHWTDGKARRLFQGVDFTANLYSFRTMVHRKARDLNMQAHTSINKADASVEVWFERKR